MSKTLIGAPTGEVSQRVNPVVVEIKRTWKDEWQLAPDLIFNGGTVHTGNTDVGAFEFFRLYGKVKNSYQFTVGTITPKELTGYWVRASVFTDRGAEDLFVGRISGEARDVHSNPDTDSGRQMWVAHEPLQLLRKIHVGKSWHAVAGFGEFDIDWVPPMNGRDERGMLVGNRTGQRSSGTGFYGYLYGGTSLWTAKQYVEYLLERFVEFRDGVGSIVGGTWTLGGQANLLDGLTTTVTFTQGQTVAAMLQRLIPRSMGVDWTIVPDATGWEVRVHALSASGQAFLGAVVPTNPNTVRVEVSKDDTVQAKVVRTGEQQYGKIRVVGRRIVCACTLEGQTLTGGAATAEPKWQTAQEANYKSGHGATENTAAGFDAARRQDEFRTIYRAYGAPANWSHQNGAAAPTIDRDGRLLNASTGKFQNVARSTLSWLPLTEQAPAGRQGDFLPPAAWVYDEENQRYVLCEEVGIGVSVSRTDWGMLLHASPNHLLAKNHWTNANDSGTEPLYDYDRLVMTIAFETDTRLSLTVDVSGGDPNDGVLEVVDEAAELWYIAPHTVGGVDHNGALVRTPNGVNTVVRNDRDRLAFVMAGALARHFSDRGRATIRIQGIVPYSELRGHILTVVDRGTNVQQINSAITSVEYRMGRDPATVLRTGFAR